MSADTLLSHLHKVKRTGKGRWLARCPSHNDKSPSLVIRELGDGRILVKCFAGCSVEEILSSVGLTFSALFLEQAIYRHKKGERKPFFPSDVFEIALREITIASVIAFDMTKRRGITSGDYTRLLTTCGRLNNIAEAAYGK